MLDVNCLRCQKKIGEYLGPVGWAVPIQSMHYRRVDGTQPAHGSSTKGTCPNCKQEINELEATLFAITGALGPNKRAESERFLAERGPANDE